MALNDVLSRRSFLKLFGVGAASAVAGAVHTETAQAASVGAGDAAKQPSMLYDTTKCVGCRACQNGCRAWNETTRELDGQKLYDAPADLSGNTWTVIQLYADEGVENATASRDNWSFIKRNCMHCLEPACVSACTVGALQKSAEGPVIYDLDRCFGCRYCMVACPYHVPRYQWGTTTPLVQKCTFCAGYVQTDGSVHPKNRLAQGLPPNCVASCPTGALVWGTREEMLAEAHARIAANPGKYTEDRVYGEFEAGGALQLILSHVPFESLGLPKLDPKPLPPNTRPVNLAVPAIWVGVGGLAAVIYNVRTRGERLAEAGQGKEGAT